jgi:hypothetical protein
MPEEKETASRLKAGGEDEVAAGNLLATFEDTPPGLYSSSLDITHERHVLASLAHLLVTVLPERSAISQGVLDQIVGGWNDLADVERIICKASLRPAGPGVKP